jgi:hypothetical protein
MTDTMTDKKPSLAELIARTPGAQPLERARAFIKAKREQLLGSQAPPPADDFAPEPLPVAEDPDAFAKGVFERLKERLAPPRGSKPRLVVDNAPRDGDDDPEPPKPA